MICDYTVASLPPLAFGAPPPLTAEKFREMAGDVDMGGEWRDLETELKNAVAEARGGERWKRPVAGCRLYWRNRIAECFQEKDPARRDEAIDRVFWDAAGTLEDVAAPLGIGALRAYAARLAIALRRSAAAAEEGRRLFETFRTNRNTGEEK